MRAHLTVMPAVSCWPAHGWRSRGRPRGRGRRHTPADPGQEHPSPTDERRGRHPYLQSDLPGPRSRWPPAPRRRADGVAHGRRSRGAVVACPL